MPIPLPHKARTASRLGAELYYRVRGHDGNVRRARLATRIRAEGLAPTFFAIDAQVTALPLPDCERRRIFAEAENASGGVIPLLGAGDIDCGHPIDWRRDPLSGRRFPSSLFDIRRDEGVDWKFSDELNKHRHFYSLGQAYALSGDERYQRAAMAQLRAWLEVHPPIEDRYWRDGLECGIRVVAWLWLLACLRSRHRLAPRDTSLLVDAIRQHTRFIERELPEYGSAFNHLIARAAALTLAGAALPCLPESPRWLRKGLAILSHEAIRQYDPDGGHREKSLGYHVLLLDAYTHVALLCRDRHIALPSPLLKSIERMYDFVLQAQRPDGMLPNSGDEGIAWHQLSRLPLLDARRLLSTGAVLFQRADMKWAAADFSFDSLWLCGMAARESFAALPARPPTPKGGDGAASGLVIWRDGWGSDRSYLLFDAGAQGVERAGHGHADALHVEICAGGAPLLVDSGTYTYYPTQGWRQHFRGTAAHNTVVVDGVDQAVPGPDRFFWRATADATLCRAWSTPLLSFADAHHDGYRRLDEPVRHRRLLFWAAQQYWLLYDLVLGSGSHRCESFLHGTPSAELCQSGAASWTLRNGSAQLQIVAGATRGLQIQALRGRVTPPLGWVSDAYGHKQEGPVLVHRRHGSLPMVFVTLLLPFTTAGAPRVAVDRVAVSRDGIRLGESDAGCVRIALADGSVDTLLWSDGAGWVTAGALSTDGAVAFVRAPASGPVLGTAAPGGLLRWQGRDVARPPEHIGAPPRGRR